jgi:hypothetical protein
MGVFMPSVSLILISEQSCAVIAPLLTISPEPPKLFIPGTAMPRLFASGMTYVSKLQNVASKAFKGSLTCGCRIGL